VSDEPLLIAEGVTKHFPVRGTGVTRREVARVQAVDEVSLEVRAGETVGLVGESGCGKSTLGRCLVRLHELTAGRVIFEGRDISRLNRRALRPLRSQMQMVFQDPYASLNPRKRVGALIGDPLVIHGQSRRGAKRRVQELMDVVGLAPEHYNRYPHEFSGGQRQRINIARALAVDPELLICDEATSALDVSIQAQILNLLADLQAERKLTYLFITHDLGVVRYFATRVAVMYLGRIVEVGPTERIFAKPRHPYTKALLASIPSLDPARRSTRPVALGDVPSPEHPPPGCHYHPRCAMRLEQCSREDPPVVAFPDGICRCVLAVEESDAQWNASF
jgi:oligopeptide/dipeptide ABC transporter ATP-binding protein